MQENLTRTVMVEDCLAIMLASERICDAFKEVIREHANFAQFGDLAGVDAGFPLLLLDKYRNNWASHKKVQEEIGFRSAPLVPKAQAESTLAFILGWLCHRAAVHLPERDSEEAAMVRDALMFHRRYVKGGSVPEPYREALGGRFAAGRTDAAPVESRDMQEWFRVLRQRLLIEMHTFVPDVEDIEGWFDRLHAMYGERAAYLDRFAAAVMAPDPDSVRRYVTATDFYDAEDAVIQLAESVRRGEMPSAETIEAALAAMPRSRYAKALRDGLGNLFKASRFFSGGIDRYELNEQLAV